MTVEEGWQQLDRRMIVVDAVQVVVSLVPLVVLTAISGSPGDLWWPVIAVSVTGVVGAAADAYRWAVTRYRVTDELVERRSGLLVRSHRSVRRDRIRTVDIHAKLRHRLGGLRIVSIGAGQQSAAGEAAFDLDAVSVADAHALRALLLRRPTAAPSADAVPEVPAPGELAAAGPAPASTPAASTPAASAPAFRPAFRGTEATVSSQAERTTEHDGDPIGTKVLARFKPGWVIYNVFNIWTFVMAGGLLWGAFWMLPNINLEPTEVVGGIADWGSLGLLWTLLVAAAAVTLLGVVGLGVTFFLEFGGFQLARVPTDDGGTVLRTRRGLLTTREVARDDERLRGVQISQPLMWRWMGVTDTSVITTGLDQSSVSQPAVILPRGPLDSAQVVVGEVLEVDPNPVEAPLRPHPRAALRRRLVWATGFSAGVGAVIAWLVTTSVLPVTALLAIVVVWPLALVAGMVAYSALGHTISGDHLVVRSGLATRATSVLQRSAVSTVAVSESVMQRRLGLATVTFMTSAGDGAYTAADMMRDDGIVFADDAAPGILTPFLVPEPAPTGRAAAVAEARQI